jgi:hypothetical protein
LAVSSPRARSLGGAGGDRIEGGPRDDRLLGGAGPAPTDRALRVRGVGIYGVSEGKIVDSRIYLDLTPFGAPPR